MAKKDDNFPNQMKNIKLTPSRQNLAPVDQALSFEQYLVIAVREGNALLAAEQKINSKNSVKTPSSAKSENMLDKANVYTKARVEILAKMASDARGIIEKMECGELKKDSRWDTFCKAVMIRGDQLSSIN